MYRIFFKRAIDFIVSLLALLLLLPLLILVTLLLLIANKGRSPFFTQVRVGKNASVFRIIKFRTMSDMVDTDGKLLPDDKRLTILGQFIRSTSIDELPQLLNILKGEMSLVGPRPLLIKYLPLYSKEQARRHDVMPGLTGWAQCHGRNALSWNEKFMLDVWYVDHVSLITDLKVILLTIKKVFQREGINSTISATMEPFKGN